MDRIDRNFDRVISMGSQNAKNAKERDYIIKSIDTDIGKVNKDLKQCEGTDVQKLHEEKKNEYLEKLLKLKRRVNKL